MASVGLRLVMHRLLGGSIESGVDANALMIVEADGG